ncbi:MAG: hypothetical protein IFK94_15870 [Acidobacteria bacterium]|uniref:Putative metallopeptidase domain-containing protein n=1 Tax=Candidatus Polarisedimenticola svalbardensis TaxID=2886004 RepID=A0A8J7CMM7_9BACT|nr:hypothetical protein [Candidatus Polarisedimenticola svalbardensis]
MSFTRQQILEERLVGCLPAATFEMETLCRLASVQADCSVPSAAVTCEDQPRMLVNPEFVERYCKSDEHLFLLIMHELYHVILAHTRMYPRPDKAHNLAFDAIINAMLLREFTGPEYRGFFENLNPADEFPACLLRPPSGWPAEPRYNRRRKGAPTGADRMLQRLYLPEEPKNSVRPRIREDPMPAVQELVDLIRSGERLNSSGDLSDPVLLGDHRPEGEERDRQVMEDDLFADIVRDIVSRWPPPKVPIAGRDRGGKARDWFAALGPVPKPVQKVFSQVLRKVLGPLRGGMSRKAMATVPGPAGRNPIPSHRDRTAPARRMLGQTALLYNHQAPVRLRVPERPTRAHVYLDVSGSMINLLPYLTGLLLPYVHQRRAEVYQFSTVVEPLPRERLARGKLTTTGGTDINPVLEHLLQRPNIRKALVVTDGYTGRGRFDLVRKLQESGQTVHVVLPSELRWAKDLKSLATSITTLPPMLGVTPERRTR